MVTSESRKLPVQKARGAMTQKLLSGAAGPVVRAASSIIA
jgi:hypothetical protein